MILVVFKVADILFKRRKLLERDTTVRERLFGTIIVLDGESRSLSHGEREPLSLRPSNHPLLLHHRKNYSHFECWLNIDQHAKDMTLGGRGWKEMGSSPRHCRHPAQFACQQTRSTCPHPPPRALAWPSSFRKQIPPVLPHALFPCPSSFPSWDPASPFRSEKVTRQQNAARRQAPRPPPSKIGRARAVFFKSV